MSKIMLILVVWVLIGAGCGGVRVVEEAPPPPVKEQVKPVTWEGSRVDKILLEETIDRQVVLAEEAVALSDRFLHPDNMALRDKDILDKLEILLLKGLQQRSKSHRPLVLRNLGIVKYHQKQYHKARQALQASSELNPRDARTHYYLACIYAQQGKIHSLKGQKRKSKAQYKRAQIELEQARKLEPANPLYRQDLQDVMESD